MRTYKLFAYSSLSSVYSITGKNYLYIQTFVWTFEHCKMCITKNQLDYSQNSTMHKSVRSIRLLKDKIEPCRSLNVLRFSLVKGESSNNWNCPNLEKILRSTFSSNSSRCFSSIRGLAFKGSFSKGQLSFTQTLN